MASGFLFPPFMWTQDIHLEQRALFSTTELSCVATATNVGCVGVTVCRSTHV